MENPTTSSGIAINIALIPNSNWINWCAAINGLLPLQANDIIFSNTCVPHVTLSMGVVLYENLEELSARLPKVPEDLRLIPADIVSRKGASHKTWWLQLTPDDALQSLRSACHEALLPFVLPTVESEAFLGDEITGRTQETVAQYSTAPFEPHVTLGFGDSLPLLPTLPGPSRGSLEIWQLGNHCTCHSPIWRG